MAIVRKKRVGWRTKVFAFKLFDKMPFGQHLYLITQRYITKSVPRPLGAIEEMASVHMRHVSKIRENVADISKISVMEFGAGWDLFASMFYYCYGIENQTSIDVRRWARAGTINDIIRHLQANAPPEATRVPKYHIDEKTLEVDLQERYGISYRAPFDARNSGLPSGSIDVISTISVLEHIPVNQISAILTECRRIISADGFMIHTIDYSDHYSHADDQITQYNYLKFSDSEWKRFNPEIHYQNRLRTAEYKSLFEGAGFVVQETIEWDGDDGALDSVEVAPQFARMSSEELRRIGAFFIVRPAA